MAPIVKLPQSEHLKAGAAGEIDLLPRGDRIADLLRRESALTAEAFSRASKVCEETGERFDSVVTRLGLLSEQALAELIAQSAGLALLPASALPAAPAPGPAPSLAFLRDVRALPVAVGETQVTIAFADPFDNFAADALAYLFARPVERAVALPSDIESAIERLYGAETARAADDDAAVDDDDVERLRDLVSDAPVIRAVNRLISDAVELRASDIHVEPADDRVVVRLRIDGVLRERPALPPSMRSALVSRIKVMAGLNIAERRLPQDGRMRVAVRGNDIDLRVATAPSIHGETVVLRILDRANLALDFKTLGFGSSLVARLEAALVRPYGIILVTGPTGSGKTTTLYAAIAAMNSGARKILTIEDPIEYRLAGVVQMQANAGIGLTFASALRSFLRQDPDVMMVGEIRDLETAQIAVQAALTGHTILSTLHTNTAAGAITRLMDMNVEPFLLSSTLNAVLAQRLVRRLCEHCRTPYAPSPSQMAAAGISGGSGGPFYAAKGCDQCHQSGYAGRIALIEILSITDEIGSLILRRADTRSLTQAAVEDGALASLREDAIAKLLAGQTTLQEVLRVVAES
jgi:general secretion pathway protein E